MNSFKRHCKLLFTLLFVSIFLTKNISAQVSSTRYLCALDKQNVDQQMGKLTTTILPNGDVKVVLEALKSFNDNTYGLNAINWPGNNHQFKHLTGSDKAEFLFTNSNGTSVFHFDLDYLSQSSNFQTGYGSLGISGGEGHLYSGNASWLIDFNTSLNRNFNEFGYVLTGSSPETDNNYTPNPSYPNWIFDMVYEVVVSKDAFGSAGFGEATIVSMHNSPNKWGIDNKVIPYYCDIPCENSLGDFVWHDKNTNGIQDAGEPGIQGVVVNLYNEAGSFISSTTTNSSGFYQFANLANGTYKVMVASSNFQTGGALASTGPNMMWNASPKNKGTDDTKDSDANKNESVTVTLNCEDNPTIDFGFFKSCITVTKTGPTEPAQPGDVITFHIVVENCGDAAHGGGVDLTDPLLNFNTNFTLAAGATKTFDKTYTVKESDCQNGQVENCVTVVGHPKDSYGVYYPDVTDDDCWTVPVDCGQCTNLIGDFVWHDKNTNGIQDAGEPGIENVIVELYNVATQTTTTTITNASGYYEFDNLPNGTYEVKVPISNFNTGGALASTGPNMMWNASPKNKGTDDTKDSDANKGEKVTVTLDCEDNPTIDFGFFKSCITVTKTGPTEPAQPGDVITFHIVVENCGDATHGGGVDLTDPLLNFNTNFTLAAGATKTFDKTYTVKESDCQNGQVENCVTVVGHPKDSYGVYYPDVTDDDCWTVPVDCGQCTNLIGDFVWHDKNTNGIQDNDEPGIENVVVELFNVATQTTTTTITNSVGYYEFDNLPNGTYEVKVPISNFNTGGALASTGPNMMWNASPKNKGTDDTKDSDANKGEKVTVTLDCEDNPTIDFGFFKSCITVTKTGPTEPAQPGDVITFHIVVENCGDATHSGGVDLTDPLLNFNTNFTLAAGATKTFDKTYTVTEDDCNNGSVENCVTVVGHPKDAYNLYYADVTDEDCWEVPVECECTGEIGDRVWKDFSTEDAYVTNCNGIQDQGEPGIPGVTVKLIDKITSTVVATTVTDENGDYLFTGVCDGCYLVTIDASTLPAGITPTPSKVGSDPTKDSNGSPAEVCIDANNKYDYTIDFGYCENVCECDWSCLGDYVWFDANRNGIQDDNESGVPGVIVQLFYGNGYYHSTTATDNTGHYLFVTLIPGDYFVKFLLPNGYTFTTQNVGNDEKDSDVNPSTGTTGTITLIEGLCNLTVDAGIYMPERPDLKLTKTVDNDHPMHGESVTFTITVTNESGIDATGVVVRDFLPDDLSFASYSKSKGTFNTSTLEWTIGTVAAYSSEWLTITTVVDWGSTNNFDEFDLGIASDYNVFILCNVFQPSADTQGKVAVGGNATYEYYSIGDQLPSGSGDVLIVGNNLIYKSGAIFGNVVYGNTTNLPQSSVSIAGTLRKDYPIDFAAAVVELNNLSAQLATYTANGTTTFQWGSLTLDGTDPYLNVFDVSGSDLSSAHTFTVNAPNGSVVLVNIDGENINWTGGMSVNGASINNVLYNFYEAHYLTIQGIDVRGSILAPLASVNFITGVQNGQMIAKCLAGRGQFNWVKFLGNIPEVPTIINVAEIMAMDQIDFDSTPGNGNPAEDDYDTATLYAEGTYDNGQGGSGTGGGTGSGEWEQVGTVMTGQIVYVLTNDNSGNLLAGTWGGMIYRSSNGVNWTRINNNMYVGLISALVVNSQGYIFAGTEQGIYRSIDNGSTWSLMGLVGKDVRAIAIDSNGDMYAGTWGFGIYKSTNNGTTWSALNVGLANLIVNSLVINSYGDLFAGTFGSGILKSTDHGASWSSVSIGYNFVWAMAVTSTNVLYAGSYGDGLYRSNNGASWTKINSGIDAQFIYALTVDASDRVYASSWTSGVFVADEGSSASFNSLGLGGVGVSSIYVQENSNTVYAGTRTGAIYKKVTSSTAGVTGVEDNALDLPTKFELDQNYPNPFNPTTTIQFSIPTMGEYTLKVYNILGQEVAALLNGTLNPGIHNVEFNATNLASGMYIYQLVGQNVNITKKMILMK